MKSKGFKIAVGVLVAVIVVLGGLLVVKNMVPPQDEPSSAQTSKPSKGDVAQDVISEPSPSVEGETAVPNIGD